MDQYQDQGQLIRKFQIWNIRIPTNPESDSDHAAFSHHDEDQNPPRYHEDLDDLGDNDPILQEEDDNSDDPDDPDDETGGSYNEILDKFSQRWMRVDLQHAVSKAASDSYWRVALSYFHSLLEAKKGQKVKKNVPQFTHIRRKLVQQHVPPICMELGYKKQCHRRRIPHCQRQYTSVKIPPIYVHTNL